MTTIETLAKTLNITNQDMLRTVAEAGIQKNTIEEELSAEEQKTVIVHLKQRRDFNQTKKPGTLTLGGTPRKKSNVNVVHKKRKPGVNERNRNIEQRNALQAREQELSEKAKKQKLEREKQQQKQAEAKQKKEPPVKKLTKSPEIEKKRKDSKSKPEQVKKEPVQAKPVAKRRRSSKSTRSESSYEPIQLNEFVRGRNISERERATSSPLQTSILKQGFTKPTTKKTKEIEISDSVSVSQLAHTIGVKATVLIREMMKLGVMATVNQSLDYDTAELVCAELGYTVSRKGEQTLEQKITHDSSKYESKPRPPVVTVMGHVDHGKTSLLDFIRKTRVVDKESGGITQHIGAYHVTTKKGAITFLDTPGHAAFSAMRARGAKLTDIVILVVAADDKVMPQTKEAIQHAKSAHVPIVVALNKTDKPESDPDRLMNELSAHELVPEEWGGDTQFIKISALTGDGIDALLDALTLQAELLELRAPDLGPARGLIIESRLDKNRGPIATVLVQQGMLHKGDQILVGTCYGRIRAQINDVGQQVSKVGPSMPVEILGLDKTPEAGDELTVVKDEKTVRSLIEQREQNKKNSNIRQIPSMEDAFSKLANKQQLLNLIIKTDTKGSSEAIKHSLHELETEDMKVNLVLSGTGGITEADVSLAHATQSRIVGFHVRADSKAGKLAEKNKVAISYYSIIYELIDDVDNLLHGMLSPVYEEKILGTAEVRNVFTASKFGKIAGCMVIDGSVVRNKPIRVIRDNIVIYQGELESLRRFKEDTQQVRSGTECGIGIKGYKDVRAGDKIENYDNVEIDRRVARKQTS